MIQYFKLEEVTELITCGVAKRPEYVEDGIPFLSAKNVKEDKIIYKDYKYVSEETHAQLTKHNKPLKGDILYTRVGSYGSASVIDVDAEFSIFVSLTLIKPKKEILNSRYLMYYLNSPKIKNLASNSINGVGVGNLNVGTVRKFPIPVPSIQEQEEIVARLDKVFNHISTQVENIKTQMNLNSLIFESYFEKIQSNFINSGTISEFFDLATGGTPSKKNKDYFDNGNIPWLLSGDIHQENISESKNFITEDGLKNSNAKYLPVGSVLIALNGQGKTRGTVAQLKINATCNQSLVSINSKDNNVIENEFLFYFLKSQYKKIRKLTGDSGNDRRGLNMNIINSMKIKFPEISVQKKIIDNCKSLSEVNKNLTKILDSKKYKYAELKSSLLNKEFVHE